MLDYILWHNNFEIRKIYIVHIWMCKLCVQAHTRACVCFLYVAYTTQSFWVCPWTQHKSLIRNLKSSTHVVPFKKIRYIGKYTLSQRTGLTYSSMQHTSSSVPQIASSTRLEFHTCHVWVLLCLLHTTNWRDFKRGFSKF